MLRGLIGREHLRAKGAFALWIDANGLRATSVRDVQGERPWAVGMGAVTTSAVATHAVARQRAERKTR